MPFHGANTFPGGWTGKADRQPRKLRKEQQEIVERLACAGHQPYRGDMGTRIEIIGEDFAVDLGRDVRAGWHLPIEIARRSKRQSKIFAIARHKLPIEQSTHLRVRHGPTMVAPGDLWTVYGEFNTRLTNAMEALKAAHGWQWWTMAFHLRWDGDAMAFDLHAHIFGWLPLERHGAAMETFRRFFEDVWLRAEPTEDADASAAYPAAGLLRDVNALLPAEAILSLAQAPKGLRLIRTAREVHKLAKKAENSSQTHKRPAKQKKPRSASSKPERPGVRAITVVNVGGTKHLGRVVRYQASTDADVDTTILNVSQLPEPENQNSKSEKDENE